MKSKVSKRVVSVILVLVLLFATQSTAFAWGHSKTVTKTMYTSKVVFGVAAKDIITFTINEKGGIEKVSVVQKGLNFLGIASISPNGYKVLYGTNKVITYWTYNVSVPYLKVFSQSVPILKRTIEYTLYNDGSVASRFK